MLGRLLIILLKKIKFILIKFKNNNASFGHNFAFDLKTNIQAGSNKLVVGDDVYLRSNANGYHAGMPFPTTILLDKLGAECVIGDNCRINGAYIHCQKKIVIGVNSVVAAGVNIIDSNGHISSSPNRTKGRDDPSDIIIGDNVWIGLNSIILKGTIIGKNSIVAAGSIVKGVFPENVMIQGNPAKTIKVLKIENENSNTP